MLPNWEESKIACLYARHRNRMAWVQTLAKEEMLDHTTKWYKKARQIFSPIEFHDWELEGPFQATRFVAKDGNQIAKSYETMTPQPSHNKQTNRDDPKNTNA